MSQPSDYSSARDTLASDAERTDVTSLLNAAFAEGRLTAAEHSERTSAALTARTHGDLSVVLRGLVVPSTSRLAAQPVKLVLAVVATVLSSPFVLVGLGFTLGADQTDELVFGLVLLALTVPGLLAIWNWAWPRRSRG